MAINFPASPSENDTFTAGSITYKWDGAKWIGLGVTPQDKLIEGSNTVDLNGNSLEIGGTPPWSVTGGDYNNLSIRGGTASSSGFMWLGNGTATNNGDFDLGRINFLNGPTIVSQIKGTTDTSANDDGRISFLTKSTGNNIVERVRITGGGNVGINETEPEQALHITVANAAVQLENPGGTRWRFANESNVLKVIQSGVAEHILLETSGNLTQYGGSQRLRSSNTSGRGKKTSALHDSSVANGATSDFVVPDNGHAGGTVTVTLLLNGNASVKTTTQWPVMWNTNAATMGIGSSLWSMNGSGGGRSFGISGIAGGIRVSNNSGGTCDVTVVFELYGSA